MYVRPFFLALFCASLAHGVKLNTQGTCRPLPEEAKAKLRGRFEEWVNAKKDQVDEAEIEKRRTIFQNHINACDNDKPVQAMSEDTIWHPQELQQGAKPHEGESKGSPAPVTGEAVPAPPVTHPPLPPFPPSTELPEEWKCIPDLTHRKAVYEQNSFPDSCTADFIHKQPWAFQDPYVPSPETLGSHNPATQGFYTVQDLGDLLAGKLVAFVGDSVMGQVADALECEALRMGVLDYSTPKKASLAMYSTGSTKPLNIRPSDPALQKGTILNRGDRHIDVKEIEKMLRNRDIDILVYNFGLHYHDMEEYTQNMTWLVGKLEKWVEDGAKEHKTRHVFFRDTSAQHFMGRGGSGDYDFRDKFRVADAQAPDSGVTCGCSPINPATHSRDDGNRNTIMQKVLKGTKIHTIPFFKTTLARYNMHQENEMAVFQKLRTCDCSHFCYMPPFWQWVIHEFYVAIRDGIQADLG